MTPRKEAIPIMRGNKRQCRLSRLRNGGRAGCYIPIPETLPNAAYRRMDWHPIARWIAFTRLRALRWNPKIG
jgi:hypothetical protein